MSTAFKTRSMQSEIVSDAKVLFTFDDEREKKLVRSKYHFPLDRSIHKFIKRGCDILFSSVIILFVLSWMLPLVTLIIKLTSKGPALFKQKRNGMDGEPFQCWKFRTMYLNNDAHLKQATINDPRITPVGKFLRKFSLDEMPQFINVLMGSMSIVGPRPHMISHTEEYSKVIDNYMARHFAKPGITGLSQIQGYRGETKCPKMMKNRVRLDIFYLKKWNFTFDLFIMAKTIRLILFGDKNAF